MTEIKATVEDIKKILSENAIPNLSFEDHDGNFYIKLKGPLPKYIGRKPLAKKKKFGETPETFHVAGPMVVITNIPPETTDWGVIKQAINDTNKVKVRFISPISEGSCFAWLSKTSNFSDIENEKILINDAEIKLKLIDNESQYKKFISVNDFVVRNFGSIKTMLTSMLNDLEVGTKITLDSQAGKLISFLLEYHPNSKQKKGGDSRKVHGFEVGQSGIKERKNKKCFCVVTKSLEGDDLKVEDVSITKCLEEMKHFIHNFPKPEGTEYVKSLSYC
nr:hypothetical protein MACL_00001258 [Theileria orientalis]